MRALWATSLLLVSVVLGQFADTSGFSFDRGVPTECRECGPCPEGTLSVCICFEKLVFQEADIRSVFALLADTAGVNIVVDPDLNIKVTLKLENVSWCQILSLLLDLYNLRAIKKEGYFYVLSNDKYWTQKFGEIDNINKEKQLRQTETRIYRIQNVSASNLAPSLEPVKSSRGEIVVDAQSNSLIITDLPEQFPIYEAMIESLDVLGRQVKVACQIVQIDQSAIDELGINWSAVQREGKITVSSNMNQVGGAGPGAAMGDFQWSVVAGAYDILTRLSAIISEGRGRILDQPHIITMDNTPAEIFSGTQIPINTVDQAGNLITQFFQIGTRVNVTPRITKDEKISLTLKIERSGYVYGAAGYEITTRSATTTLTVASGDVIVIGGLVTNERQESEYGVPILKDLPLIGGLFKYTSTSIKSTVITIFITPEII